jgi:hypothetical protein
MFKLISNRAQALLENPLAYCSSIGPEMKRYPGRDIELWVSLEIDSARVKKMSFSGELSLSQRVLLEATAAIVQNRPLPTLGSLTIRECEAFLRDRNSEPAWEGEIVVDEESFKKWLQWMGRWSSSYSGESYRFSSQNGPFERLRLVDKIKELKAFLASSEVCGLYQGRPVPELVDVEDLTVYVQAPYRHEEERALFEELHQLGVAAFQEERLNFIPED